MAGPSGALGSAYKITRGLQVACLITIIGMTANFVSEMVSANTTPPKILVATLSIVRLPHACAKSATDTDRSALLFFTALSQSFSSSTTSYLTLSTQLSTVFFSSLSSWYQSLLASQSATSTAKYWTNCPTPAPVPLISPQHLGAVSPRMVEELIILSGSVPPNQLA